MRPTLASRWSVIAVLALVPAVAWAEDPVPAAPTTPPPAAPAPATASPAEAARKARAAFPEPSEKGAFSVTLDLLMNGTKQGEVTFTVGADVAEGSKTWKSRTELLVGAVEKPQLRRKAAVTLERTLRLVDEEQSDVEGDKKKTTTIVRTEKGFEVSVVEGDREPVKTSVEAPADATTAEISSLLLFLRMCPADPAKYEVPAFKGDEKKVTTKTVEVKGAGRMTEAGIGVDVEALVAVVTDGKDVREVFLDPKDRSVLGMHSIDRGSWVVRKGLAKPKDVGPVPDYKAGAQSAKEAGIKLGMGTLTGDLDVVADAFHWPSMAGVFKELTGMDLDEEMAKTLFLDGVKSRLQDAKPEEAWVGVKGAADGAKETENEDGTVSIRMGGFPAYKAKAFDGKWLIVWMDLAGAGK
jgi:hypothetical protein